VRIIIDHFPEEYQTELSRFLTTVSLRKEVLAIKNPKSLGAADIDGWTWLGDIDDWLWTGTNKEPAMKPPRKPPEIEVSQDRTFSSEWLPAFKQPSACLTNAYVQMQNAKSTNSINQMEEPLP
jgi:hypothetical protein